MKIKTLSLLLSCIFLTACSTPGPQPNSNLPESRSPSTAAIDSTIPADVPSSSMGEKMSDCHKIAFAMFNFNVKEPPDIYTICPDGSGLTRITNHPNADETPAWSPDGQRLAFVSNRTGSYQIFIVDSDGGNINQVTTDYDNSLPIWLPDGQHIAFRTTDNEGLWWWRKAKLDGSEVEKISEASYDFFYQTPAWSPDGKKMAYMSLEEQKERNDGSSQIHIKNLDGTNDMALTHDTWENASPVWSPDGKNIAFVSEMHGEYNIFALYIMRSDGSKVKQLTRPVYTDVSAIFSWSPDGKQIAIGDINIGRISIISVSNGESRELYYPKEGEAIYAPAWQP